MTITLLMFPSRMDLITSPDCETATSMQSRPTNTSTPVDPVRHAELQVTRSTTALSSTTSTSFVSITLVFNSFSSGPHQMVSPGPQQPLTNSPRKLLTRTMNPLVMKPLNRIFIRAGNNLVRNAFPQPYRVTVTRIGDRHLHNSICFQRLVSQRLLRRQSKCR